MHPVRVFPKDPRVVSGVLARIWAKSIPEPNSGCRLWEGAHNSGYGILSVEKQNIYVHRFVCEATHGEIGNRLACHSCDVSFCVEPGHLFPGSFQVNVDDCIQKGRWSHGEKHGSAVLAEGDVTSIRARRAAGERTDDIAVSFGLHPATVRKIVARSAWRHVP